MKDPMDSATVGRALDPEVFANRKLIRPALNRNDHPGAMTATARERATELSVR